MEHLLLPMGAIHIDPGSVPLAAHACGLVAGAYDFARNEKVEETISNERDRILYDLSNRLEATRCGYAFQQAELVTRSGQLISPARPGDVQAKRDRQVVRCRLSDLVSERRRRIAYLETEPDRFQVSCADFMVLAPIRPSSESEDIEYFATTVPRPSLKVAIASEEQLGATGEDVSAPELARRVGLIDWLVSTRCRPGQLVSDGELS